MRQEISGLPHKPLDENVHELRLIGPQVDYQNSEKKENADEVPHLHPLWIILDHQTPKNVKFAHDKNSVHEIVAIKLFHSFMDKKSSIALNACL